MNSGSGPQLPEDTMAFAAVLFTLPVAVIAALWLGFLNGVGLTECAALYVLVGIGGMMSFFTAAALTGAPADI